MGFNRFSFLLSVRVATVMVLLLVLAWLLLAGHYPVTVLVVALILIGLVYETTQFVSKTNRELTRFLDALRYGEFTQRFDYHKSGAGFEQLGETLSDILARFSHSREQQEQTLRFLKALVEQVPVPLLSVQSDGHVTLWNHNARRLVGQYKVNTLNDLAIFGRALPDQIHALVIGERRLVDFETDGVLYQMALSASQVSVTGRQEKLVSLQDISSELDLAQLKAWQDLVRVLTHEIMNSITPIASLAQTATDLVTEINDENTLEESIHEQLDDVKSAVQTLTRRSQSLMQFVSSYRRLMQLPPPTIKMVSVKELFNQVCALATQNWADKGIALICDIQPDNLCLEADASMLEQMLINVLQNAEQALERVPGATVTIAAFVNKRSRGVIEVSDNGEGIRPEIIDRVFVPFFTTKREGTGVGLALTRQIMIAHGGNAMVRNNPKGGACVTLTF